MRNGLVTICLMALTLLGLLWTMAVRAASQEATWQALRVAEAVIQYRAGDEQVALQVGRWYRDARPKLARFYQLQRVNPFRIVVMPPPAFHQRMAQAGLPEWVQAVFFGQSRTIIIKSPRPGGSMRQLARDFVHELAHLYTRERYREVALPLWYNEGLSEYISQGHIAIPQAIQLANALWSKRLIPLMAMENLMGFSQNQAQLAYLEALSAVRFLESLFPPGVSWPQFHERVAHQGWPQALKQTTGLDDIGFQIRWFHYIRSRYRWMIVLNLENFLWFGLLLVFVVIFVLIRRRNRRRLQLWELEERLYPGE